MVRAHVAAKQAGLQFIVGARLDLPELSERQLPGEAALGIAFDLGTTTVVAQQITNTAHAGNRPLFTFDSTVLTDITPADELRRRYALGRAHVRAAPTQSPIIVESYRCTAAAATRR